MRVEYHPLFQGDLNDAALYYLKQGGTALANAFIDEVEEGILAITRNPLACSKEFAEIRRFRLRRFRAYAIRYFLDEASGIILIGSIIHGARHPDTAKERF